MIQGLVEKPKSDCALIEFSADQAPTRSGAVQTIEPQEARSSTEVTICDIDTIVDFDIDNISVSINVRNGVTGSLGDPATPFIRNKTKALIGLNLKF